MKDFFHPDARQLLQKHGLDSFAALWDLRLITVDEPNVERDGWSSVCRLDLEGTGFYLKRQVNYLTRTFCHPMGEPTASREFRTIMRYQELRVPALEAVFHGKRKESGEYRAILLTRSLDGWAPLAELLTVWPETSQPERQSIISACAGLIGTLHAARLKHGCLYPKHLFLQQQDGQWHGRLIDLEKTRRLWLGWRDQIRDLETFLRTTRGWSGDEQRFFLERYLQDVTASGSLSLWQERLGVRRRYKEQSC